MSSSACGSQADKKAQMIATGAQETGPCDHRNKFRGVNAVSSYCFEMDTDVSAFLPIKVSFVSLQSEEFHIYTQYCTNYPRYDTHSECSEHFCSRSCCFKSFGLIYVDMRRYVLPCADCCGEMGKHSENDYRGTRY